MYDHPEFPGEPARGRPFDLGALDQSGSVRLRRQLDGEFAPPQQFFSGLRLVAADVGRSRFCLPIVDWWLDETGTASSAARVFAVDAPVGSSVLSTLAAREVSPTAELSIVYLADPAAGASELCADADLLWSDGDTAVSTGAVADDTGVVCARATTRIAITRLEGDLAEVPPFATDGDTPDPHLRPAPPLAAFSGTGRDRLRAAAVDPALRPPIDRFLALEYVREADGSVDARATPSDWLTSPSGQIYGGYTAAVLQRVGELATLVVTPSPICGRTLDMKVQYQRPLMSATGPVSVRSTIVHAGSRIATVRVEAALPNGKPAATASLTLRTR